MVALLTDFGASEYVGIMKGILYRDCPDITAVDLHHGIAPHDVRTAAWVLLQSYRSFPPDTIFLCVVDPGVGTARSAVAVETVTGARFVGPDNGLLYPTVQAAGQKRAVVLPVPPGASALFHGRDVFAPAAARLASGHPLQSLGAPVQALEHLDYHSNGREGEVVRIDHFGNVITNVLPVPGRTRYKVHLGAFNGDMDLFRTYAELPMDTPALVISSADTLEIAVRNGSATEFWSAERLRPGARVFIG